MVLYNVFERRWRSEEGRSREVEEVSAVTECQDTQIADADRE